MRKTKSTSEYILTRDKDGTLVVWPFEAMDTLKIGEQGRWIRYKLPAMEPLTKVLQNDTQPTVEEFTGNDDWDLPILTMQVIKVTTEVFTLSHAYSDPMPDMSED